MAEATTEVEVPPPDAPTTTTAAAVEEESPAVAAVRYEYGYLDDLDLPPLRIHATRVRDQRLSGSNLLIPLTIQQQISQKRYSLDSKVTHMSGSSPTGATSTTSSLTSFRGHSRSRSPSLRRDRAGGGSSNAATPGDSSFSSLEEFVDPDILYDKMGFVELDMKEQKKNQQNYHHQHSHSYTFGDNLNTKAILNLTPVSERMSEDTLEDVHAFSDLSANTNTRPSSSVGGSTVGGEVSSHVLEPLDEVNEDDIESDEGDEHHNHLHSVAEHGEFCTQVIVTNMENITLQQQESNDISQDEDDGVVVVGIPPNESS